MLRLFFGVMCLIKVASNEYLDVNTTQGPVRGYKSSEEIFEFHGIPYATAPTGRNKFKAPLPPPTWSTIFEATKRIIACPQHSTDVLKLFTNLIMKEDCLITNIYVPDTENKDLPVVVYIHGGAYQYGFGEFVAPKELVKSKKVIALNFNYRLGINGFLCLGTKDVPGNAAMKDQIALLRWVQKNIRFFGGNPNDVTISGCSAGGSCVDLHTTSKLSAGLFNKAITESGSCIASSSIQLDPIKNAKTYASLLNFKDVDDIQKLEEFYKNAPLSLLTSIDVMERYDASVVFTPCIERDVGQEIFMDKIPFKSGEYRPIPILFGHTDMEGWIRISYYEKWHVLMIKNFSDFLPENLEFKTKKQRREIADKIKDFYFGNDTKEISALGFVNYLSDTVFNNAILRSVDFHTAAGNNQIYLYEYSFVGNNSQYNSDFNSTLPYLHGAYHCAQSKAVLDEENEIDLPEDYKKMKAIMRELWLNFIITGTPVPHDSRFPSWPPVQKDGGPYMTLNSKLRLNKINNNRAKFWDDIYNAYYRTPIAPHF